MSSSAAESVHLLLEVRGPTALSELGPLVAAIGIDLTPDELYLAVIDAGGVLVEGGTDGLLAALPAGGASAPTGETPGPLEEVPAHRLLRVVPAWALLAFLGLLIAMVALVLSSYNSGAKLRSVTPYETPVTEAE